MFKTIKEAIYEIINECADELAEMQHIENVASLYKEDD